ncbi:MAG: preprotein translocase subunit SecG [Acutalibacteraceae bacterium]
MGLWEIILGALVLLIAVFIIITVILQEGHQQGIGTVTGGADSFLSKGKARTADAMLAKLTKFVAILFFFAVIAVNIISYFVY